MKRIITFFLCTIMSVLLLGFTASAKGIKVSTPQMKSVVAMDTTTFKIR